MSSTVPLTSQVGGHAGVLTSEDGSLLIKPALPLERHFYQTLLSEPNFAPLLPFVPRFYGTLKLEGKVAAPENADPPSVQQTDVQIVAVDECLPPEEKDKIFKFFFCGSPKFRLTSFAILFVSFFFANYSTSF
jgi:hypothetical protein